jgi:hypothetical protein
MMFKLEPVFVSQTTACHLELRLIMLGFRQKLLARKTSNAANETAVLEALQKWISTVNSRQPSAVSRLYSDDAVFLPTLSHPRIHGSMDRTTYFAKLLGKSGFRVDILELDLQILGDVGVCSGIYDFDYAFRGDDTRLEARFSMVFQRINGVYRIVNHHSSQVPDG